MKRFLVHTIIPGAFDTVEADWYLDDGDWMVFYTSAAETEDVDNHEVVRYVTRNLLSIRESKP